MTCNYCDYKVRDDAVYCPNCGEKVNTKKKNLIKEQKEKNDVITQRNKIKDSDVDTTESGVPVIWGLLGFFIPLAGIILYAVWRNTKPKDATAAGIGALIRFVFMFITFIISMIVFFFSTLINI